MCRGLANMRNWESQHRNNPFVGVINNNNNNNSNESALPQPPPDLTEDERIAWLDLQEQKRKLRIVIIRGVPYKRNENLMGLVVKIGMRLGLNLTNKICGVRRCGKAWVTDGAKRPIEVTFYNVLDRRAMTDGRKRLTSSLSTTDIGFEESRTIHVNECLTTRRHRLLGLVKVLQREKCFRHVWVDDGEIYVKRGKDHQVVRIRDEDDRSFNAYAE